MRALLAYKRGERGVRMVRARRARGGSPRICRERKTLTAERVEHVNQIKGLLFARASLTMNACCAKDGHGLRNSDR